MAVKAFLDDMPGTQTEEMLCDSFKKHPLNNKVRRGSQSQKTQRERNRATSCVVIADKREGKISKETPLIL